MPVTLRDSKSTLATDPLRNFKFLVTIPDTNNGRVGQGFADMGFMSLTGLNLTTEPIAYRQGGYNTTMQKMPGQSDFSPITLQTGAIANRTAAWYWMKEIFFVQYGGGVAPPTNDFRRNLEVSVLQHPNTRSAQRVKLRFKIFNAWPVSLSFSDLDAGGNQVLVQQMTLVHEGWDITWAQPDALSEAGRSRW